MELFCSISFWASSLNAHSRAASGWALWSLQAQGCPLFSGGSFVSSGPSGLGLLGNGAASRLRGAGLPQCLPAGRREGKARRKNEDEVDVSCVELSADQRSVSEDSGGGGGRAPCAKWQIFSSISVKWSRGWPSLVFFRVGGQFSCHCFLRRLFARSWFDFHELTTDMWVYSWALYSFLESMCLCSCQFLTVVVTTGPWCSLKLERKMPPAVFFFLRVFLAV